MTGTPTDDWVPVLEQARTLLRDLTRSFDGLLVERSDGGLDVLDPALGEAASCCVQSQVAAACALVAEQEARVTDIPRRLVAGVAGRQHSSGGFVQPYGQASEHGPLVDVAELGASADALLHLTAVAPEARIILERGAEHLLDRRAREHAGAVYKNPRAESIDVLNGDLYAAQTLVAAYRVTGTERFRVAAESVVAHLENRFGAHERGWWPYSERWDGSVATGNSVAYQATIVGWGRAVAPFLPPLSGSHWQSVLDEALDTVAREFLRGPRPETEAPEWSRDWSAVAELLLAFAASPGHARSASLARRELRRLTCAFSGGPSRDELPRAADRTPVKTGVRSAANLAAVLVFIIRHLGGPSRVGPLPKSRSDDGENAEAAAQLYLDGHTERDSAPTSTAWNPSRDAQGAVTVLPPNRVTVEVPRSAEGWVLREEVQFQPTMMWKHSLGYLPSLLHETGDWELVESILAGYREFLATEESMRLLEELTSLDHCVAVRLRALTTLSAQYGVAGRDAPPDLVAIMAWDVDWAMEPESIRENNHGMLLTVGVLHAAFGMPHLVSQPDFDRALSRAVQVIENAFDADGVCRENTPAYHEFYLRSSRGLLTFVGSFFPGREPGRLQMLVERATTALSLLTWPDGSLPPIGDSGVAPSTVGSVDGELFAPASGFFVKKKRGFYVSFRCGYSSITHKHMDDTALTVAIDRDELLLDGGLHNYDWNDPVTRCVKSQRGHSGLFFPTFDDLYPGSVYLRPAPRVVSGMRREKVDESRTVSGWYVFDDEYRAERRVTLTGLGRIEVFDTFEAPDEAVAVQRFLLPAHLDLTIGDGEIRASSDRAWLRISFDVNRLAVASEEETDGLARGWVSRALNDAERCRVVDIGPAGGEKHMVTTIEFGRVGKGAVT